MRQPRMRVAQRVLQPSILRLELHVGPPELQVARLLLLERRVEALLPRAEHLVVARLLLGVARARAGRRCLRATEAPVDFEERQRRHDDAEKDDARQDDDGNEFGTQGWWRWRWLKWWQAGRRVRQWW